MPRSFRFQVTLLFGALTLAMVTALALALGTLLSHEQLRERGDSLRGIADGVALMFSEGLRERLREVSLLAQSDEAQRMGLDPLSWKRAIDRLRSGRLHYAWMGVADAQGKVVAASGDVLFGQDVSQRPWFQGARRAPFVGDLHAARLLAQWLPRQSNGEPPRFIDVAAPLAGPDGERLGVLGAHIDWQWARDVIELLRSEDARNAGVLVYVFDRDGKVIHRPAAPTDPETDTLADPGLAVASTAMRDWLDGQTYLTAAARLPVRAGEPGLGWTIVVRQPAEQALRGVAQAQRQVWMWGTAVSALAMLLAWWAAGLVSHPLRRMSQAARRIEAGDHEVRIPQSRQNLELDQLSRSLAGMTEHLVAREQELAMANQQLEARVAARTAELGRANAHLERLAHQDSLTGLHNRRWADQLLDSLLAQHRRHQRPFGLLLCDIDHFKSVNDRFGHSVGDDVLRAVALTLRAAIRESDCAARFGGEEFMVLLPETDTDGVAVVAEKIRSAVAELKLDEVGRCTISIGGAAALVGSNRADELLARADEALYAAKAGGRNRVELAPFQAGQDPGHSGWINSTSASLDEA